MTDPEKNKQARTQLTQEDLDFLAFQLAARLDDAEKELKKHEKAHGPAHSARKQIEALEMLLYSKLIPNSYHGPEPAYWNEARNHPLLKPR